jgi:AmiR/NasT family two-component response regulator
MTDLLLLAPEWPERALLRAELIEAGFDVVAIDRWEMEEPSRPHRERPRVVVVDIRGLEKPRVVLEQLQSMVARDCILVLTALGALTVDELHQMGHRVIARPTTIRKVVEAAVDLLRERC